MIAGISNLGMQYYSFTQFFYWLKTKSALYCVPERVADLEVPSVGLFDFVFSHLSLQKDTDYRVGELKILYILGTDYACCDDVFEIARCVPIYAI